MSADEAGQKQLEAAIHTQLSRLAQMVVVPADIPTKPTIKMLKRRYRVKVPFMPRHFTNRN